VTKLAAGVDELEIDLFGGTTVGLREHRLAEGENTLANTNAATFQHDEVVLDHTVMREATHGGDPLFSQIELGRTVVLDDRAISLSNGLANAVDLLVHLGTVVETVLTSASNSVLYAGRMPCTNTGDLTETLVSLARQLTSTPTMGDTLETVTLGHTNDVNHLVLTEDGGDGDLLLQMLLGPVDLGLHVGTSVDLNLHQVGLLLAQIQLVQLSVSQHTDDLAVLDNTVELLLQLLLASLGGQVLGVLGEGLLLGGNPVLVEATLDSLIEMLSPDGGQRTETARSLDVTNDTNNHQRRGLNDGDGLDDLLLVSLGTRTVQITHNVGHTSLVAQKGSQMGLSASIVLGESLYAAAQTGSTLTRQEAERAMARGAILTVSPVY